MIKINSFENHDEQYEESMTFTAVNAEGEQVECEVLFAFESEATGRNYIVYTDNTLDKEGHTRVFASVYDPNVTESKLEPIETEEEWKIIETILEQLRNQANQEDD